MGEPLDEQDQAPGGTADQKHPGGCRGEEECRADQKPGGFDVDLVGGDFHVRSVRDPRSRYITLPDDLALPRVGDSTATLLGSLTAERCPATMGPWPLQLR